MSELRGAAASSSLNLTNGSGPPSCDRVEASAHVFFLLVYSLVFLVGLFLNGFTLKVYFCRARRPASSSVIVYLKNLAAADFLVSLCLPVRIANYGGGPGAVRKVYCNFGAATFYLNMYASILFMGYIAANRYLKIVRPLGNHVLQTVRAAHVVSGVTWVLLLVTTGSYAAVSLLTEPAPSPPASAPGAPSCDALRGAALGLFYKAVHCASAAAFLLVLGSLLFFYRAVSRRLASAQRSRPAAARGSDRKLAKSRRNMRALVGVFCVCFVPYHLVRLPYAFLGGRCRWSRAFFYLKELTVMVSVLNVCLDPLIYFLFCKAFRAQMSPRRPAPAPPGARRSSDGWLSAARKTSLSADAKHLQQELKLCVSNET